jgi:hypothetical protein
VEGSKLWSYSHFHGGQVCLNRSMHFRDYQLPKAKRRGLEVRDSNYLLLSTMLSGVTHAGYGSLGLLP